MVSHLGEARVAVVAVLKASASEELVSNSRKLGQQRGSSLVLKRRAHPHVVLVI